MASRRRLSARPAAAIGPSYDPDAVRSATRQETLPVALGAVALAFLALTVCYSHGYLLLYGDAVAHLGIARRILDSRNPGLAQLGGVWLPLPHLLMMPFVGRMEWWRSGLAGAWPSLICYVAGVAGVYRLARRMVVPRWAIVGTAFFALNPNLLYLATTAMTEPLFLALLIWLTLGTLECVDALRAGADKVARRRMYLLGLLIVGAVYTRYDGWVLGAAVWCVVVLTLWRYRGVKAWGAFAVMTMLTVAAPLGWLAYNHHFMWDALDFMRGPYSAAAIERKTTPVGAQHYNGWHHPLWAGVLYTRTAQVDAVAWEFGFGVMAAAVYGVWSVCRRRLHRASLLLWVPLPFYMYSVSYGHVPIFIPQMNPHSFYNSRYGMELLPALALFLCVALGVAEERVRVRWGLWSRLMEPVALVLVLANTAAIIYWKPLVLKEAIANSLTRVPFEAAVARELMKLPVGVPILMAVSDHVGAVQQAEIPLRQIVSEGDRDSFQAALAAPANHAAYAVSFAGDAVFGAIPKHPEGLTELTVVCSTGQGCARVYKSDGFGGPR